MHHTQSATNEEKIVTTSRKKLVLCEKKLQLLLSIGTRFEYAVSHTRENYHLIRCMSKAAPMPRPLEQLMETRKSLLQWLQ